MSINKWNVVCYIYWFVSVFWKTAVFMKTDFHAGIACIQILMHRGTELEQREHIQTLARPIPPFIACFA